MPVLITVLALIVIFLAVILIRAALFRPRINKHEGPFEEISLENEKIVSDMAEMIRCKTVSHRDHSLEDKGEFEKFQNLLIERFPLIHEKSELRHIGRNGLLYHIKGKSPSMQPQHHTIP